MPFSAVERSHLIRLIELLTGVHHIEAEKVDYFLRKIKGRLLEVKCPTLAEYLQQVLKSPHEQKILISLITIHTTSWFREPPHFVKLSEYLKNRNGNKKSSFKIWSAACSTGEEVYSIGLSLWKFREQKVIDDFTILGTDIDRVCIEESRNALYPFEALADIDRQYHSYLLTGSVHHQKIITPIEDLRERCHFNTFDLSRLPESAEEVGLMRESFDVVFCRNVLIYFPKEKQFEIINHLLSYLKPSGWLILGHSDIFQPNPQLKVVSSSIYKKLSLNEEAPKKSIHLQHVKEKILVIDDSSTIRRALRTILEKYFEIVEAESAEDASLVLQKEPFVLVTLDLNLPGQNGYQWLHEHKKKLNCPVIIISESSPAEASKIFGYLENGAQEYLTKSQIKLDPSHFVEVCKSLIHSNSHKAKYIQAKDEFSLLPFNCRNWNPSFLLIGASTGGPEALVKILSSLPKNLPPILVVQHILPEFASSFAHRLSMVSNLREGLGNDWDAPEQPLFQPLERGCLYIAKGDYHLLLSKKNGEIGLEWSPSEKVNRHRPSIDVLFESASKLGVDGLAMLLTGMGSDGAQGLKKLAQTQRVYTMVQDRESSVVFGMPLRALELGGVCWVGNLEAMRREMLGRLSK